MESYGQAVYNSIAETFRDRILALIPEHPDLMTCGGPSAAMKVTSELQCDDLSLSMFQAQWALAAAREAYRKQAC